MQRPRPSSSRSGWAVDCLFYLLERLTCLRLGLEPGLCPANRVDDGAVITAAELAADLGQGEIGELAAEVDSELAGADRRRRA